MNKLFDLVDRAAPELKALWLRMGEIETPSNDKTALDQLAELLASFAADRGLRAEFHPFPNAGNGLVISYETGSEAMPVTLMAHMDTVHQKGTFGPVPVTEEGEFLKGPGIYDCKGGIAVALLAMTALKEAGFRNRSVRLVLSPDEEVSTIYSGEPGKNYLREQIRGSAFALNCESGSPQGNIVTGRKGVLRLQVDVKGKAAHAGSDYARGISAIREAAHKIIHIEAESDPENITYNCGLIEGGTVVNCVPERCSFVVDVRFRDMASMEKAEAHVRGIAETSFVSGSTATVTVLSRRPPMEETEENLALFAYVRDISAKYGLGVLRNCFAGGASDSCYSVSVGVPTLCAMGIEGHDQHTKRERAYLSSLTKRAKLVAAAIAEYDTGRNEK